MGRCVEHTKGRHMCPALTMEAYTENAATVRLTPHHSQKWARAKNKVAYEEEQLFTCIFQYVIGYGSRNSLNLFMFTMIRFPVFVLFRTCPRNAEHYEAAQGYANYPPYLHVYMYCTGSYTCVCVCVCVTVCVTVCEWQTICMCVWMRQLTVFECVCVNDRHFVCLCEWDSLLTCSLWVYVCVCVFEWHILCVRCVLWSLCVCACDSVLLVPMPLGGGGWVCWVICQCICLCYIVLKNSITGQKQCNSFHLCSKGLFASWCHILSIVCQHKLRTSKSVCWVCAWRLHVTK